MPTDALEGAAQVERLGLALVERDALLNRLVDEAERVRVVAGGECLEGQKKGLVALRRGLGKSGRLTFERDRRVSQDRSRT